MRHTLRSLGCTFLCLFSLSAVASAQDVIGKTVNIGDVALQIHCTGKGSPTVVIETGLGDFSFDFYLVQRRVEKFTRICTYDRGGYGASQLSDAPRTFAQLNLELHDLLRAAGEKAPFILVGHSFGGPVTRNYAKRYPEQVAGMVLAESVTEHQPILIGGKPTLLKDFATGRALPEPRLAGRKAITGKATSSELPRIYLVLPPPIQELHRRFAGAASLEAAENGQREWASEYLAEWDRSPQAGMLSPKPLVVLTRAQPGFGPSTAYSVEVVDGQRLRAQTELLSLSTNSLQLIVPFGHSLHLEAPEVVVAAIRQVVTSVRSGVPLAKLE